MSKVDETLISDVSQENEEEIFIGRMIQEELKNQERTVTWLARKLNCDRTNIYDIFKRHSIDSELLLRVCVVLNVNFFDYYVRQVDAKINEHLLTHFKQQTTPSQS